ncbi:LOW QUALITY PROTEIN: hypothetical protein PHMEG_0009752 [Phytophthora megakarya]|uniref:Ubiquitin-like protease family profile domain-containing protein n=1 Tax=Phytophthora megakarya TaxID=4795 RepID=A0A225WGB3_9STRA|nr:LOW QUALITY PROTEIN: hypothetical protein PHMEG_0009752 [Phytophthora megakarya]
MWGHFDMERKEYDPFHKETFLDEVQNFVADVYMNIMKAGSHMKMRTFPGWLQRDGCSCGVLVLFNLRSTSPGDERPFHSASRLDTKPLSCVRYKHFSYLKR